MQLMRYSWRLCMLLQPRQYPSQLLHNVLLCGMNLRNKVFGLGGTAGSRGTMGKRITKVKMEYCAVEAQPLFWADAFSGQGPGFNVRFKNHIFRTRNEYFLSDTYENANNNLQTTCKRTTFLRNLTKSHEILVKKRARC